MQSVLINGLQLSNENSGVQYYTKNLYENLLNIENGNFKFDIMKFKNQNRNSEFLRYKRILYENLILPGYISKKKYALFHSPNYVLPLFSYSPSVLTIHDLITFDYPELCKDESVAYFKILLGRSLFKANKIISVSNVVKNDILRHFNIPSEKIKVIYLGINKIFKKTEDANIIARVKKKYGLPEKFLLFVGNIEPKKNIENLLRAFNLLLKTTKLKYKLVVVGKKGWKFESVFKIINELKINNEVIFTGYVPEEELPTIYSLSDLFVFPSLYEGFGIPPLEAMACEIPVLISNRGSLPEVTGGHCIEVDPQNISDITAGIFKILSNDILKQKLVREGKIWANQYSWEKTARNTLAVYEEALKPQHRSKR